MNDLVWYSSLATVGLSAYWAFRRHEFGLFLWTILVLGALLGLLVGGRIVSLPWAGELQARGRDDAQWALVAALYVAMVLGMLAHYVYGRLQRLRGRRRKFDVGALLAPVFVSPIVFLPLASILQSAEPVQASASRLMLFLVAFENGFFWREFFENRVARAAEGGE